MPEIVSAIFITLKEKHPDTARCLGRLGVLFQDEGEFEKARKYHEDTLVIYRTALGGNHPDIYSLRIETGIVS
jgi:hypothetical protein